MDAAQRAAVLHAYVGERGNRRHKPGRAFERTSYRFDILTDYGAFRDLQRHRLLTLEWQRAQCRDTATRFPRPCRKPARSRTGSASWTSRRRCPTSLAAQGWPQVAPYAISMAYRVRFYMELNAREAMHMIELRTAPQGHPAYRRVCQAMHTLIDGRPGTMPLLRPWRSPITRRSSSNACRPNAAASDDGRATIDNGLR